MGGAERVVSRLANYWAASGRSVTIITALSRETDFYVLDARIRRVSLAFPRGASLAARIVSRFAGLWRLKRLLDVEKPDVTIAFMTDMNIRLSLIRPFLSCRTIISERTNPARQRINARGRLLRRLSYRLAEKIVFVSEGVAAAYPWLPRERTAVIYNPMVDIAPSPRPLSERPKEFVSVGRFVPAKGFDLMIDAFARIAGDHPDWTLRIVGEGPLRPALEHRIREHGLADRIMLPGKLDDPQQAFAEAQVYVLSSRHEGFPNALVEAMCAGLPPVSFACAYGPSEIIADGRSGLLVPPENVEKLAAAMSRIAGDADLREALRAEASTIADRLTIAAIAGQWEALFR